jgi:D-proline reductase (dithiol) PrdB
VRPNELPLKHRLFLRTYVWRTAARVAAAELRRPVTECRVALVTTAGLVPPGDPPFDLQRRGGDWSFRVLGASADLSRLSIHHRSDAFDRAAGEADPNVVLPLDALRGLAARRAIGELAPRHVSFMGSITAPARLVRESAPAAADLLVADGVDVALLVPV